MPLPDLVLNASDVAACIGWNQWKPRQEMVITYLRKLSLQTYITYVTISGTQSKQDMVNQVQEKIKKDNKEVASAITQQVASTVKSAVKSNNYKEKVATAIKEITTQINTLSNLTPVEKELLTQDATKTLYTNIGTKSESKILEKAFDPNMRKESNKRITRVLGTCYSPDGQAFNVCLHGVTDGVQVDSEGNKMIIEAKKRMNRLFRRVVSYEYAQVQTYMWLNDVNNSKLVESFEQESMEHPIEFDKEEWARISKEIFRFASDVMQLAYDYDTGCLFPYKEVSKVDESDCCTEEEDIEESGYSTECSEWEDDEEDD